MTDFEIGDIITPHVMYGNGHGTHLKIGCNYHIVEKVSYEGRDALIVGGISDDLRGRNGNIDTYRRSSNDLRFSRETGHWLIREEYCVLVVKSTGKCAGCINTCHSTDEGECPLKEEYQ